MNSAERVLGREKVDDLVDGVVVVNDAEVFDPKRPESEMEIGMKSLDVFFFPADESDLLGILCLEVEGDDRIEVSARAFAAGHEDESVARFHKDTEADSPCHFFRGMADLFRQFDAVHDLGFGVGLNLAILVGVHQVATDLDASLADGGDELTVSADIGRIALFAQPFHDFNGGFSFSAGDVAIALKKHSFLHGIFSLFGLLNC